MAKIEFTKIKEVAEAAGAKKWAIQKWRQRGIPIRWQVKLMVKEPGAFSFHQFDSFNSEIEKTRGKL